MGEYLLYMLTKPNKNVIILSTAFSGRFQWRQHGSIPGLIADKTQQDHYTNPLFCTGRCNKIRPLSSQCILKSLSC